MPARSICARLPSGCHIRTAKPNNASLWLAQKRPSQGNASTAYSHDFHRSGQEMPAWRQGSRLIGPGVISGADLQPLSGMSRQDSGEAGSVIVRGASLPRRSRNEVSWSIVQMNQHGVISVRAGLYAEDYSSKVGDTSVFAAAESARLIAYSSWRCRS